MNNIITLPIQYNGIEYYSLVRFTKKDDYIQIRITIMNGALEKMLFGNNIFKFKNGSVVVDLHRVRKDTSELQSEVVRALEKYFVDYNPHSLSVADSSLSHM